MHERETNSTDADRPVDARAGDSQRYYFPEIDGLRFLAFALVFIFHCQLPPLPFVGLIPPLKALVLAVVFINANGWLGVDLFFVISGFLIASVLFKEQAQAGAISLKRFYARRVLRIFPVYYAFLIIDCVLALIRPEERSLNPVGTFVVYATFIGNMVMAAGNAVLMVSCSPLWSLCIEEQFYLLFGQVMRFVKDQRRLLNFVLAAYGASVLYRIYLAAGSVRDDRIYYYNTFTHIDGLACGIVLAIFSAQWQPWLREHRMLARVMQALSLLALGAAICTKASKAILITLCCPLFALLLAATITGGNRVFAHPLATALGRRTYSMYVVQFAAFVYVTAYVNTYFPEWRAFNSLFVFVAVLILAELSWRLIEKPNLKRKRKYEIIQTGAF